ncbi:MAG: TerB family tellurite resistance protein [Thermoanaerobaculales bacterium]|jgi:uncharacterized tellurite resistance protein B-like protein|nr:TerB family tellurite resistance protein [Thermoanaerobaculales bacterium]
MNPDTSNLIDSRLETPVLVVRQAIEALNALDPEVADHLSALAFILVRVAKADGTVCGDERLRMEQILVERAHIPAAHAAIVTEIACHRTDLADCGCSYSISRGLRTRLDQHRRRSIAGLLAAVAEADGCFCPLEHHEVDQIAGELGISAEEVAAS